MKLRLTRQAVADISNIASYIRDRDVHAAQRVRTNILDGLRTLVLFPRLGRRQTTEPVRKLVTPRYGYVIYYLADEEMDELVVLTVQHPAREPM